MLAKFFKLGGTTLSTYANDLIFGAGSQEFAVRAEADASDVQVSVLVGGGVGQVADLLTSLDVENLCRPVAASGDIVTIRTEADTAHHTLVHEVVDQLNVQPAHDARVEYRVPVLAGTLQGRRELIGVETGELISDLIKLSCGVCEAIVHAALGWGSTMSRRRRRACHMRRTWVGVWLALLRCCQSINATIRTAIDTATGTHIRLTGTR
jgi:hypothetical protein